LTLRYQAWYVYSLSLLFTPYFPVTHGMRLGYGGPFNALELTPSPTTTPLHGNVPGTTVNLFQPPPFDQLDELVSTFLPDQEFLPGQAFEEEFSTLGSQVVHSTCPSSALFPFQGHASDASCTTNNEPVPMTRADLIQEGDPSMIWSTAPANSPQRAFESARELSVRDKRITYLNQYI
jgi:hypothetical protein